MAARPWPTHPSIYEINTWVWLDEKSRNARRELTLASVPDSDWDAIAALGFDAVWLMGVWERSPAGIAIANHNEELIADFRRALPDFKTGDNVGSPYCVHRYEVAAHLGGRKGLAAARAALARRGLRLVLDFVPNHVAPDHPWALEHPDYFVAGDAADLARDPAAFVSIGAHVFARGRDPYFPPWPDVLQLNAFSPALRNAVIDTLNGIADQCDAVRCDMAMLMLNEVFDRTWHDRAGPKPQTDYWRVLIPAVTAGHSQFKFIAEAYWDLEWVLQQQGFDFCYDKRLYDRLEHERAESVRQHLSAGLDFQDKLIRFIENHDEPRAAAAFAPPKECAAAVTVLTLPGAKLTHEGQFEGRRVRVPVFLSRRPPEPIDGSLRTFYGDLLRATSDDTFRSGEWQLCERAGWPDNASFMNVVAWCWRKGDARYLIVVNLSDDRSQARVRLPWSELSGRTLSLQDPLAHTQFERSGGEACGQGLYVELPAWGHHFFKMSPQPS